MNNSSTVQLGKKVMFSASVIPLSSDVMQFQVVDCSATGFGTRVVRADGDEDHLYRKVAVCRCRGLHRRASVFWSRRGLRLWKSVVRIASSGSPPLSASLNASALALRLVLNLPRPRTSLAVHSLRLKVDLIALS